MNKKTPSSMEDQLRLAIRESGKPQNEICRAAKMDEGTLSCFMLGKQESMRLKTAQRLARVLGKQIVLEPGQTPSKSNGKSNGKAKPADTVKHNARGKRPRKVASLAQSRRRPQRTA